MPRTCVVTGAAGFIGSRLCAQLLDDGSTVHGLDRLTDFTPVAEKRRRIAALEAAGRSRSPVDLARDDVRDASAAPTWCSTSRARRGARQLRRGRLAHIERNVRGTERLAEAIARRGAGRLVMASSSSVYGDAGGGRCARTGGPGPDPPTP